MLNLQQPQKERRKIAAVWESFLPWSKVRSSNRSVFAGLSDLQPGAGVHIRFRWSLIEGTNGSKSSPLPSIVGYPPSRKPRYDYNITDYMRLIWSSRSFTLIIMIICFCDKARNISPYMALPTPAARCQRSYSSPISRMAGEPGASRIHCSDLSHYLLI